MDFPRRGEIFLVRLPGHPSDQKKGPALADQKKRPVLVVSIDVRNRLANDVMVVPLTTRLRPAPTHVALPSGEGGIALPSLAKCEQLTTLDKSFLFRGPFAGAIHPALMQKIEKAIQRAIGMPVL